MKVGIKNISLENKSGVLKSVMVATALLSTQVQASDLIAQCDFNGNKKIDGRTVLNALKDKLNSDGEYSIQDKEIYKVALTNAKKERKCKKNIIKEQNKKQEIYLAQLDTSIEGLKKELEKVEDEIRGLKEKLQELKEESQELKEESQELKEESQELKEESQELKEEKEKIIQELEEKKEWLLDKIKNTQQSFSPNNEIEK